MYNLTYGNNFKFTILGGSHDEKMRLIVSHFPGGVKIDLDSLKKYIDRRRPNADFCGTPRTEDDEPIIVSGISNGVTSGEIVIDIQNKNVNSYDYDDTPRPSHADYVSHIKYGKAMSGAGIFSGRITLMYTIMGFFAKSYLVSKGIQIDSFVTSIGSVKRDGYNPEKPEEFGYLSNELSSEMVDEIKQNHSKGNSIGGVIEGVIRGLPVGLGSPIFSGLESKLSSLLYSIPAVKGVSFGAGFDIAKMTGSCANDEFIYQNDIVKTITNNNGGINGGISNGMPIVCQVAFKPTPSISIPQNTVSLSKQQNVVLEINGRHDACIVARAGVVVESMLAIGILDEVLGGLDGIVNYRNKIDIIDDEIIELIKERLVIAKDIGVEKKAHGIAVENKERECEIISKLSGKGLEERDIERLYSIIFEMSKMVQE